ncbi:hypothetical protein DFO46_0849 [Rhizobium sp. AG855]|nr:hypothetical protein DFO46_0849 [Rhizobium sp. AG855]
MPGGGRDSRAIGLRLRDMVPETTLARFLAPDLHLKSNGLAAVLLGIDTKVVLTGKYALC